jgi:hypothetical protein
MTTSSNPQSPNVVTVDWLDNDERDKKKNDMKETSVKRQRLPSTRLSLPHSPSISAGRGIFAHSSYSLFHSMVFPVSINRCYRCKLCKERQRSRSAWQNFYRSHEHCRLSFGQSPETILKRWSSMAKKIYPVHLCKVMISCFPFVLLFCIY